MTGRNDPCPCGSGKKFKKCCEAKQPRIATNAKNAAAASKRLLSAVALHQAGHLNAAEKIYREILAVTPTDSNALHYLGLIAFQRQNFAEAVTLIEQAIKIKSDTPAYFCNLGNAYIRLPRYQAAREAYQEAVRLDPQFAVAWIGLGNAHLACGQSAPAVAAAREAVSRGPQLADAWIALGDAQFAAGLIDEAEKCYRQALVLNQNSPAALTKHANVLTRCGRLEESEACVGQALRLEPGYEPAYWTKLMNLGYRSSDQELIYDAHRDWAKRFAPHDTTQTMRQSRRREAGARIRVGYVSADFRRHALRFFIRPILRHHDRARFEVHCYHNHAEQDEITQEIKTLAEHWLDCHRMSDAELAARVVADEIDILIDLSGHTRGNRLQAFAMKPAPVQATMLGYLNTTGLKAMDYRIVDRYSCPPGRLDELHSEALVRLPNCQWCYEPEGEAQIGPLPALTNNYLSFGSFHNRAKITPDQIELFCEILRSLPEARLLQVAWGDAARQQLLRVFAAAGLASRVQIVEPKAYRDYLALYDQVDVVLDAFPYCGGTTSMEALWMGVPLVTMRGTTPASNGGASILSNLGLPQLIADGPRAYVDIAIRLAADIGGLDQLRHGLRERLVNSPVMQAADYVRALEAAYLDFMDQVATAACA